MSENTPEKVYKTADITLAATLIYKEQRLIGIEQIEEKRKNDICRFLFEDSPARSGLVMEFTSRKLFVEPTAFMANVRSLKQLIKENKEKRNGAASAS